LKSGCEASPQDLLHLGFPLILKPARRDLAWDEVDAKGKAVRVDRPEQLREVWPRLAALEGTIIAQRHIDGPESCIESYHVYVDQGGEIAGEFTGRKIRTLPTRYGHTTALTITSAPDVLGLGRDLTRVLGLTGVAKFDFKRGPDGELYLLEVNPRFSLWHHPGARAGVNIPALVYADLTGRARPAVQPESGLHWCHPKDFWAARQSGVPLAQWARWAASCEAKAFWAWDDPLPFLGTAADVVLGRLR
jgi:predicted ATP-grasp superfamily ATP-dependent carboligase